MPGATFEQALEQWTPHVDSLLKCVVFEQIFALRSVDSGRDSLRGHGWNARPDAILHCNHVDNPVILKSRLESSDKEYHWLMTRLTSSILHQLYKLTPFIFMTSSPSYTRPGRWETCSLPFPEASPKSTEARSHQRTNLSSYFSLSPFRHRLLLNLSFLFLFLSFFTFFSYHYYHFFERKWITLPGLRLQLHLQCYVFSTTSSVLHL